MSGATSPDRLTRVETILSEKVVPQLEVIVEQINKLREDADETRARLDAFENKGKGLLLGVAIAGAGIGAGASKLLTGLFGS